MKDRSEMAFFKKFFSSPLNVLTYGSIVALALFLCCFNFGTGYGREAVWRAPAYYISEVGKSLESLAVLLAYLVMTALLFLVIQGQVQNFMTLARGKSGQLAFMGRGSLRSALCNSGRKIGKAFCVVAPAFFLIFLMSFVLDGMNAVDRVRLVDISFLNIDHAFLGGYAFMVFSSIPYPSFFIKFIIFSFESLVGGLILSAFLLAYVNMRVLREMVASFCFCALLMVPFWVAFPALSPQDRFVDNIYHLSTPPQIMAMVSTYHPDAQIATFLASVRTSKNSLADMPTSTMPSAHAAWAMIMGYYLFRAKKWLGWIALPFLLASTAGTVILAQHYFLDIVVGILIAALAIKVVEFLISRGTAREIF
jgi:membrane-associated phospholipid phosphatase